MSVSGGSRARRAARGVLVIDIAANIARRPDEGDVLDATRLVPHSAVAALSLPWSRYDQVICGNLDHADERAWLSVVRIAAARVRVGGRLYAEHDDQVAAALHPLFAVADLEPVVGDTDADAGAGRERAQFRRTAPAPSRVEEIRLRLRAVRRVPPVARLSAAEAELTTGTWTGGEAIGGSARVVVRVHDRPVGMIVAPTPITRADLRSMAAAVPVPVPPARRDSRTQAPAEPMVFLDPADPADLTEVCDAVGRVGWLVFSPFLVGDEDRRRAGDAIRADGDRGVAALIGTAVPLSCPDSRAGRWMLHDRLVALSAFDPPAQALSRLAGSGYAAVRASAVVGEWSGIDRDSLVVNVARLLVDGQRVSVSPGLILTTPGWSRHQPLREAFAAAACLGRAERAVGRWFGRTDTDRPSEFAGGRSGPAAPFGLSTVLAAIRAAARRGTR